jgi:hypothetical protein
VTADPVSVPADATREELEDYRRRVEDALLRVTEAAERLAGGTRLAA